MKFLFVLVAIPCCLALPFPQGQQQFQQQQFQQQQFQQQQPVNSGFLPTFEETGRFIDDTGRGIDGFYRETAPVEVVRTTDHVGATVNQAGSMVVEGGGRIGEAILLGMSDVFHGIGYKFDYILSNGKRRK